MISSRWRAVGAAVAALLVATSWLPVTGQATEPTAGWSGDVVARDAEVVEALRSWAVQGETIEAAALAAEAVGLTVLDRWEAAQTVWVAGDETAVAAVGELEGVVRVEPNASVQLHLDTAHRATRADDARSFSSSDGTPYDGSGVSIGIFDTGVDASHPFFRLPDGSSKVVESVRITCAAPGQVDSAVPLTTARPLPDDLEVCGPVIAHGPVVDGEHGSHVAGIAAGIDTVTPAGERVRGAAPGASLVAIELDLYYGVFGVNTGLQWLLDHHRDPCGDGTCDPIRVVNNSWSVDRGDDRNDEPTTTDLLVDALVADGVTVVFAASNDGGDGTRQETSRESDNRTPGVISVASYNDENVGTRSGQVSGFSSRGELGNPYSYPDLAAPGHSILSACPIDTVRSACRFASSPYQNLSGTSMAAPYVAGVVALLLEADPDLTPAEIEHLLEKTAHPVGPSAYEADPANADSLISHDAGHGLVDVAAVLGEVLGLPLPDAPPCSESFPEGLGDGAIAAPGFAEIAAVDVVQAGDALRASVALARDAAVLDPVTTEWLDVDLATVTDGVAANLEVVATHERGTGAITIRLRNRSAGPGAPWTDLAGTWDAIAEEVTFEIPLQLTFDGTEVTALVAGSVVERIDVRLDQDVVAGLVADRATIRCPLVII